MVESNPVKSTMLGGRLGVFCPYSLPSERRCTTCMFETMHRMLEQTFLSPGPGQRVSVTTFVLVPVSVPVRASAVVYSIDNAGTDIVREPHVCIYIYIERERDREREI